MWSQHTRGEDWLRQHYQLLCANCIAMFGGIGHGDGLAE